MAIRRNRYSDSGVAVPRSVTTTGQLNQRPSRMAANPSGNAKCASMRSNANSCLMFRTVQSDEQKRNSPSRILKIPGTYQNVGWNTLQPGSRLLPRNRGAHTNAPADRCDDADVGDIGEVTDTLEDE